MYKFLNNVRRVWENAFYGPNYQLNILAETLLPKTFNINDIFDGFLWGVPKRRRSIAIRIRRKHADNARYNDSPRNDILTCADCGHFHLKGCICENCYQKVKFESQNVLKIINPNNQYAPIEHDIKIKYRDDPPLINSLPNEAQSEFVIVEGKKVRIVEIDKPRPLWFHNNLLKKGNK